MPSKLIQLKYEAAKGFQGISEKYKSYFFISKGGLEMPAEGIEYSNIF